LASPARIPPDEELVEQSSTPWRVFDAPSPPGADTKSATNAGVAPPGSSRPSVAGLEPGDRRLALAGILGAAAIGAIALVIAASGAGATTVDGPGTDVTAGSSGGPSIGGAEIVVDVGGAVVRPGVYRLAAGARIGDAIDTAGGFSPRVDVDRVGRELNLAATLTDGAQVRVPSRGDPGPSAAPGSGGGTPGSGGGRLVNLNTATESELDALPGIGPVTAAKILESRAGSPFRSVDELRERGLVGEKTFEKLRPLLTVG
jgi:competence protein ComEA